ncbi:hypothetical protein [Pseudomonas sp. RIT-PI-AD]|uniref:hypothetical protein n=1 Tax=Pseudomonas sp. RIT-PI-AD TaxID=3035294 RepID=UPI0021D86903|nr:hypothetical protein [Pseudomonas sp. RIT-PI-AD]
MNAPLRFNEALLITGRAFQPFQCIAWAPQDGSGELDISVLDKTSTRLLGHSKIPSSTYCDPQKLATILEQSREELCNKGYMLAPWSMPD